MKNTTVKAAAGLAAGGALLFACQAALAGPPFMTDDPEPLAPQHSEAYVFSTMDKGPGGRSTSRRRSSSTRVRPRTFTCTRWCPTST